MSSLSGADREILEIVFGMKSGYVMDFNNERFEEFFKSYDVDIYGPRYRIFGDSKAKRMRAFWRMAPDALVGRVLFDLLKVCEALEWDSVALKRGRAIAGRLSGISLKESAGARDLPSEVEGVHQKWFIRERLEEGGFGRVHLAKSESGETAVIKLIEKDSGAERELLFEGLDGVPNVVPILDRGECRNLWFLVMPKADRSLRDHLNEKGNHLSVDDTVQVLSDVAQALAALDEHIVHRDIKPDNILLLKGKWCLADFGISRYAEATTAPDTRKYSMTFPYAAPEQWRGDRATSATDVYALGVVAYELLTGELPFAGPNRHDFRRQHLEGNAVSIPGVPRVLQSLIDECLYKAPGARLKPIRLLARLKDIFRVRSEAEDRLQQANALEVQGIAEAARQESLAMSDVERRSDLLEVATLSFGKVVDLLNERILVNASAIEPASPSPNWSWSLRGSTLSVAAPSRWLTVDPPDDTYSLPFEIIVQSNITLRITPHRDGYEGRSHSLWYCDAQDVGEFRWFETAFMKSQAVPREVGRIAPFALEPGRNACIALSPGIVHDQVAWPFTPIDQGAEGEFIERWMGWFADGAQGLLSRPKMMPEREAKGSWRRSA